MVSPTVRVEGLNELIRTLRRISKEYPKEMKEIHKKLALPIAAKAAGRINSKSGRLAGAVRQSSTQKVARVSVGKRDVVYAGVNHFGWPAHNIVGNPFLYDTITAEEATIIREYEKLTRAFIERVFIISV